MTFFTAPINDYLDSMKTAERLAFLEGYANDAGAAGEWHKQHEIQARINQIRAENEAEAAAHDQEKKARYESAMAESVRRGNELIDRGI